MGKIGILIGNEVLKLRRRKTLLIMLIILLVVCLVDITMKGQMLSFGVRLKMKVVVELLT